VHEDGPRWVARQQVARYSHERPRIHRPAHQRSTTVTEQQARLGAGALAGLLRESRLSRRRAWYAVRRWRWNASGTDT